MVICNGYLSAYPQVPVVINNHSSATVIMSSTEPYTLRIALDWTPNTLHAGLYLALHQNLYSNANLTVHLLPPDPAYSTTPAKLLAQNSADLAICPSESCIAYAESRISASSPAIQAIYAICAYDASAIVSVDERFARPRDLGDEGATYGSYNARYEDDIVRAMVEHDGGRIEGLRINSTDSKLSLFDKVRSQEGDVDATWVFMPWEGVMAEMEDGRATGKAKLNVMRPEDYGVPYGYSPVIARNAAEFDKIPDDVLRRFVKATRQGYRMAADRKNRDEAVEALLPHCDPPQSREFLERSLEELAPFYDCDGTGNLGYMLPQRWMLWVRWLKDKDLIKDKELRQDTLYTNEFFEPYIGIVSD